ncbi:hypothetical protein [Patulibacter sp.]|uniref:hypothetical protein n=1 Tax=Patulibacter sp. TaxID=1912859 RepID=UPI002718531E|nr:hypothetical protein [Patulibacter sp.]MDO9408442.1 hypothetical protein [Patulibacter sp.]
MSLISRTPARILGRRAVPWLLVLDLAREGHAHWQAQLTPKERSRMFELLKASKGRPSALGPKEQAELKALGTKLDVKALGKRAAMTGVGVRAARKKNRKRY